jgi:pimeloyl-ACP methyl ester carboxylesterase
MISRRTFLAAAGTLGACSSNDQPIPARHPETAHEWQGFRYFSRGNASAPPLVVAPVGPKGLGHWLTNPTIDNFVDAGFHVVGVHWHGVNGPEDYGARHPKIAAWLDHMRLKRPPMYAQSRGGLQLLNFACDHPSAFSKIAALYPVTDPFVFPGRKQQLWTAYGVDEARFPTQAFTPNARAATLKGRQIRIWHGDRDKLVPKHLTTDIFAAASGAEVVTLKGVGHVPLWLDEIAAYLHG